MMLYDLFLHRRPFVLFFFVYAIFVVALSVGLQRLVSRIYQRHFLHQTVQTEECGAYESEYEQDEG